MVWQEVRGAYQWIAVDTTGCGMPKCPPVRHRRSPLSLGPGLPRYVAGMHLGMSRHPRVCRILAGHGGVGHGAHWALGGEGMPKSDLTTDTEAAA